MTPTWSWAASPGRVIYAEDYWKDGVEYRPILFDVLSMEAKNSNVDEMN